MMSIRQSVSASIIVSFYNELDNLEDCIESLMEQTDVEIELIFVNDGSTDRSKEVFSSMKIRSSKYPLILLNQIHSGPGIARNFGASKARAEILVFLDADMLFSNNFVYKLIAPITSGKAIGTFSQDEVLANSKNYWAKCWNMGRFASAGNYSNKYLRSMIPNLSDKSGIFRAILKSKFDEVGGFEKTGDYSDDGSLAKKLGVKATLVRNAVLYHKNPSNIFEVWERAGWIGSGRYFTNGARKKIINLFKFSFPASLFKGILISLRFGYLPFIPFKIIYDLAIWLSVIKSI